MTSSNPHNSSLLIDPQSRYRLIYTSVAFSRNTPFLTKLRDQYGVIIPFLDYHTLSQEMRDAFDTYLYLPDSPQSDDTLSCITRAYPQVTFTLLGTLPGRDITKMLDTCVNEVTSSLQIGHHYKILTGPYRNLVVKMESYTQDLATVSYQLFTHHHTITLPPHQLTPTSPPPDPQFGFTNLLEQAQQMSHNNAIIIDGNNALYRNMFGYSQLFTRLENRFVGGAFGFYFTFLKLKELYPEYTIHVVFDGYDADKMSANPSYKAGRISNTPKFKAAFRDNLDWVKRFSLAAGFSLYHYPDLEADDVIGSLAHHFTQSGYRHVIIYSADTDFCQLASPTTTLCQPKASFRGHTQHTTQKDVLDRFGITEIHKVNWVRALAGDSTDNIPSINIHNKTHSIPHTQIRSHDYLPIINTLPTLSHLTQHLTQLAPYTHFITSQQFARNLDLLTLNLNLFPNRPIPTPLPFSHNTCTQLLEEMSFYKELEQFDRSARIFRGIW